MHYFFVDFLKILYFFFPDWFATSTPARLLRNLIDARFARACERSTCSKSTFSLKASSITDNG